MYIFGKLQNPQDPEGNTHEAGDNSASANFLESEDFASKPTIILCCPNAGYYEFMCWEVNHYTIYLIEF
jgi:hypothetical protein